MKKKWVMLLVGTWLFSGNLSAQAVTQDSINVLNNEKSRLKVEKSLNENKLKLAKLENQVAERTANVQSTGEASQKAANDNQEAANILSSDSQDKGKAKTAKKAARYAEKRAKDARKALDQLDELNSDIEKSRKKVQEDEQKLAALGVANSGI